MRKRVVVLVLGLLGLMALGFAAAILLPVVNRPPAPPSEQHAAEPQPVRPARKRPSPEGKELSRAGGDRARIKAILARGADIDALDDIGWTALENAASTGDVELVRFLLDSGADPNARDSHGDTALGRASCVDLGVAELLIERGAEVNVADDVVQYTPLHHCANRGELAVVELLLAHGAEVNALRDDGSTPLHDAARRGRRDVVEVLLEHGADPSLRDERGRTPLFLALDAGAMNLVDLLAGPGSINLPNEAGTTPLMAAIYRSDEAVARWLVEHGADVRQAASGGDTALHVAAGQATVELVRFLLDEGADANAVNSFGGSALDRAEFERHADIAALLIERGAHVDKYRCMDRSSGGSRVYQQRGGCPPGVEASRLPD